MNEKSQTISPENALNIVFGRIGAQFEYQEFLDLFNNPNNRDLENTVVIKALHKLLQDNSSSFVVQLKPQTVLYRGRLLDERKLNDPQTSYSVELLNGEKRFNGLDEYDSKEPPLGRSPAQRNNYKGASYLYLSEDKYTACAEIRPGISSLISLAEFKTLKPLRIFDFASDRPVDISLPTGNKVIYFPELISEIMYQFSVPVADEKEYDPSQYISDYVRKYGFDGIRYKSMNSQGYCYTLFNCSEDRVKYCSSELVFARVPRYAIYSLNDNSALIPPEDFDSFYSIAPETFDKIKDRVFQHIERNKRHG